MKKTLLTLMLLHFFVLQSFSQNTPEEYNSIQKFIESTVQIPFIARVADVQGVVTMRITMGIDSLPLEYKITQSLRPDCDLEALRVVKLLNIKMLRRALNGKKKMLIEVPFFNKSLVSFGKGFVVEYFDKNNKAVTTEPEIRLARRYAVDSLTGIIKGDLEYFDYKNGKINAKGIVLVQIDSSNKNYPNFMESPKDTIRYRSFSVFGNKEYPVVKLSDIFDNGIIRTKYTDDSRFIYYPNGRIEREDVYLEKGKEKTTNSYKWFANGQLESIKISKRTEDNYLEKIIAVWDTSGKQLVKDGNGFSEAYHGNIKNISIESGLVQDSLKEGKWIAKTLTGIVNYEEIYKKGNLIEGKSFEGNQVFPYKGEQNAEYSGGMRGFGSHLQSNLKYPSEAQRANISGTVYVQFIVCTDGTLCDYKVLKGIGFGCDEESIRVLQLSSGKWEAAKQRGKPVRSRFTIPIKYQLSR